MSETKPPRWTEYMPLDDVLRAPRNPKNHNAVVISNSMARFGVVELPALDERTGRLVAGHGRLDDWKRRRDNGEAAPEGVVLADDGSWTVPVTRGWASRSDPDAEAYLVVSNRSTELGGWDTPALTEVLEDLKENDLLELTGYTNQDLAEFLAEVGAPEGPGDFPSYDSETISTEHQCPSCGYRWSGSSAARGDDDGDGSFGAAAPANPWDAAQTVAPDPDDD